MASVRDTITTLDAHLVKVSRKQEIHFSERDMVYGTDTDVCWFILCHQCVCHFTKDKVRYHCLNGHSLQFDREAAEKG